MKGFLIKRIKTFIGLKLMSFFVRYNYRLITLANERMFEYPWVLTRCRFKGGRMADFGCRGSMLIPYFSSLGYEVYGIDLNEGLDSAFLKNYPNYRFIKADMRKLPFNDNFFDISFSISTLEHIFSKDMVPQDKVALKEIFRTTKPGGQILITMPYGKGQLSKGHIGYPYKIYNRENLKEFLDMPDLGIEEIDYFIKKPPVWIKCSRQEIEDLDNTMETKGTVCISLVKKGII